MTGKLIQKHLETFGITPSSVVHRNEAIVMLRFPYNKDVSDVVKTLKGRWSKTHNSWYLPKSKTLLVKLIKALAEKKGIDIEQKE